MANGAPYDAGLHRKVEADEAVRLVDGPHFLLDQFSGKPDRGILADYADRCLLLPVSGEIEIGGTSINAGNCALAGGLDKVDFTRAGRTLVTRPLQS